MEKLTIEVPPESICVKHAECPNGHSLMDPTKLLGSAPSIKVLVITPDGEGEIHLNPWYGNFDYESSLDLKDGEVYEVQCPTCRASLRAEEDRCMFCGAPMFTLKLPRGGLVSGCCRKGCHNHKFKIVDLTAQLAQIFDLDTRPRY